MSKRGRKTGGLAHQLATSGHGLADDPTWDPRLLSSHDPTVRERALGFGNRSGLLTDGVLVACLGDPAQRVRLRALRIVATNTDEVASAERRSALARPLIALLLDPDELVAEAAAFALGELLPSGDDHINALEHAARSSPSALVREAAVAALGAIGNPGSLPVLLAATTDKPPIRRRAVIALAAFEGPEVEAALERAAGDRDWQVRDIARALRAADGAPRSSA